MAKNIDAMTELELYKYINDNGIEVHITRKGAEKENMQDFNDENWKEWTVLMFPMIYQLQGFVDIASPSLFDDDGLEIVLKHGYVVIDLFEIMQYYGIEPKNVFK